MKSISVEISAKRTSNDEVIVMWSAVPEALAYVVEWSKENDEWWAVESIERENFTEHVNKEGKFIFSDTQEEKTWCRYRVQVELQNGQATDWHSSGSVVIC